MMKSIKRFSVFWLLLSMPGWAGVMVMQTRAVIQPDDHQGVTVKLHNMSKSVPYLIQFYISNENTSSPSNAIPFKVLPPLMRINADTDALVRVVPLPSAAQLPQDRESMFVFNSRVMPSLSPLARNPAERNTGAGVTAVIDMQMRLFFRPQHLPVSQQAAFKGLQFIRNPGVMIAKNNSPYYLILNALSFDNSSVALKLDKNNVLSPFSEQRYAAHAQAKVAKWVVLDDAGSPKTFSGLIH